MDRRRVRARRQAERRQGDSPLARLLAQPLPEPSTPTRDASLLAVDLETTGLNPRNDRILSVGFVPVDGVEITLSGARHIIVRPEGEVGQSAVVHGLTDDVVAGGVALEEALAEVLAALEGRVLLAHYAVIEEDFLSAACRRVHGAPLAVRVVDTLEVQRRLTTNAFDDPRAGTLRLPAARRAHGLPVYRAHAALTDALACAELYLAQRAVLADKGSDTLAALLR